MKKLIVVVIAIAAGFVANAAQVQWKSSAIKGVGADGAFGSTSIGKGNAMAQLYYITGTEYSTWLTALTKESEMAGQATQMQKLAEGLQSGKIGTGKVGDPVATGTTSQANITDPKNYTGMTDANPVDAYAAIIYSTTVDEKDYLIANVGTVHMTADLNDALVDMAKTFGGANGSVAIKGWAASDVPEPTSGLLLVLGMAGLALRRKQK